MTQRGVDIDGEGFSAAASDGGLRPGPDGTEFVSDEPAEIGPPPAAIEREQLHQIRKTVLYGIGGLLTLSVVLYPVLAVFRPEVAEQFANMSQSVTTGLLGIGGTAAGYAFGRHK
jgi:hypothetical protein